MNQTGVISTGSPLQARRNLDERLEIGEWRAVVSGVDIGLISVL
jgi:hypothetical protein